MDPYLFEYDNIMNIIRLEGYLIYSFFLVIIKDIYVK